jgi:hypothetical protein
MRRRQQGAGAHLVQLARMLLYDCQHFAGRLGAALEPRRQRAGRCIAVVAAVPPLVVVVLLLVVLGRGRGPLLVVVATRRGKWLEHCIQNNPMAPQPANEVLHDGIACPHSRAAAAADGARTCSTPPGPRRCWLGSSSKVAEWLRLPSSRRDSGIKPCCGARVLAVAHSWLLAASGTETAARGQWAVCSRGNEPCASFKGFCRGPRIARLPP